MRFLTWSVWSWCASVPYLEVFLIKLYCKYIDKNVYLGQLGIDKLNKLGKIQYKVKLAIDVLNNIPSRNSHCLNDTLKFKFWVSLGYGKIDNYKEIVEKYNPWKNEDKWL